MLKTTQFHIVYATGEEHEPIEFFFDALMESKTFDLGLGFFSSSAISALSAGFAYFIHRGGKMRIIINDILPPKDKEAVEQALNSEIEFEEAILNDIKQLFNTLSKQDAHFFKCLSYLVSQDRIEFLATKPLNKKSGIAHNKYGIFKDDNGDKVAFNGSANFSKNALVNNVESISCYKSWSTSKEEKERLIYFEKLFSKTWNGKAKNIEIIPINKVKTYIQTSFSAEDIEELLKEEVELTTKDIKLPKRIKEKVEKLLSKKNKEPHFPIFGGKQAEPRQYQKDAYNSWVKNNYQGIYAMATGTGKTITSLNCVLNEYKKNSKYNVLILVPTRALVSQWIEEASKFNFKNIYTTKDRNWFNILSDHLFNIILNKNGGSNIIFISTYASFNGDKFQRLINKKSWSEFILIADEAHNMGSSRTLNNLPQIITKKIGLSATPERVYDEKGTNEIYSYFNSKPPCYTYSYSMYKAITQEPTVLTKYFYYPYFTHLNEEELIEYTEITQQLFRNYDAKTGEFNEFGKRLLIKRKRIINKAENKLEVLKSIFLEVKNKESNLKYTFVYVPEGKEPDIAIEDLYNFDNEDRRLIDKYAEAIRSFGYSTHKLLADTKKRDSVLNQFEKGLIDVLLAMKILDEGVDIPITKNAIFCASTGNPRQYIQRRGRVLRKYPSKEYANVYDIIVAPEQRYIDTLNEQLKEMEINIFRNELRRVANFLYTAENRHQVLSGKLGELADIYGINIYQLIEDNLNLDNECK